MAIIETGNDTTNNQGAAPQPNERAAQGQGQTQRHGLWSFHQQHLINSPVAAGVGGEYFTRFRTQLTEIYKLIAEGVDIRIISLNKQSIPSLRFSALVVVCRQPAVNESAVAFHTLVLEATGDQLQPVVRNMDNQQVRINRVTSDAFDEVLYTTAYNAVQAEFPNSHVYSGDAMVVPSNIQPDKGEIIENIARNAALACISQINIQTDNYGELNLAFMDRECRFVIDVSFGNPQVYDVVGRPERSSVRISYSSQKKNANNSSGGYETVNVQDSVARICELNGFLNPIWAPMQPQGGVGFQNYTPNVPQVTQKFAAEFVITSVRTDYATSPAATLLALSSFLSVVDNDAWIQAFLPRLNTYQNTAANKVDITDIGALNITANVGNETDKGGFGAPVDIANMKGDIAMINQYLVTIFRPGVVISLDCPEAGPSSWYLSVFAEAAGGNMVAYDQIYNAAMELTNGQFKRFFEHGSQMFTNIVRVPLGFYMQDGQAQDIRNIDYTAISNIFAKDPSVIHEYSNTFVERAGVSAPRNLTVREGLIMHALQEQAQITGYAARVSMSDHFVKALSLSIAECNLPVQVNTPFSSDQLQSGVSAPGFVANSLAHNTRTFASGYSGRQTSQYRFGSYRR